MKTTTTPTNSSTSCASSPSSQAAATIMRATTADDNQKRRRHRGGRARRIWRRWSMENPVLATLLVVFVGMCLVGMLMEGISSSISSSGGGVQRHSVKQRMRRAKALLNLAARPSSGSGSEEGGDDEEEEEESASGDDERERRRRRRRQQKERRRRREEEEEEEEEGDDGRRGRNRNRNGGNKKKWNHRESFENKYEGEETDDGGNHNNNKRFGNNEVEDLLEKLDQDIRNNRDGGIRWIPPFLMLPPIEKPGRELKEQNDDQEMTRGKNKKNAVDPKRVDIKSPNFRVKRNYQAKMAWEKEYDTLQKNNKKDDEDTMKPPVDYATHAYDYPPLRSEIPDLRDRGDHNYPDYPPLQKLGDLMKAWPQDDDFPGAHKRPIPEKLLHFNYSNPEELEMARKFRDAELPFKLYDIPEVTAATAKWTDEYVSEQFDGSNQGFIRGGKNLVDRFLKAGGGDPQSNTDNNNNNGYDSPPPRAEGTCQESPNNYFAFFQPNLWDVKTMGLPPVRNNDWTFEQWSKHARYADAVGLNAGKPHFYWQSGVPREERHAAKKHWTFISRDLPSISSPTETFFVFEPESQKGIQCRFGERGVVAATHYDSGRNMIAMVTGAKRYILAPPKECPSLGIVPWKFNTAFRHSLLNFGHINHMNETSNELDDGEQGGDGGGHGHGRGGRHHWKGDHMSQVEREWMEIAASSMAVETVLKAGEVLYIPSHWFHYIVSLQKSAQCNVRSGVHDKGSPAFGGKVDVKTCGRLSVREAMGK